MKLSEALPIKLSKVKKHSDKKIKRKSDGGVGDDFFNHHAHHSGPHLKGKGAEHATYDFDDDNYDVEGGLQKRKDKQKRGYEPLEASTSQNVPSYQTPLAFKKSTRGAMDWDDEDDGDELLGGLRDRRKKDAKKFGGVYKKESISDKMSDIMSKLAKSLGIKSVVSMHTGKGSLSYFLDDKMEAKKLSMMLKKSFKRVRLIPLDKSKGDTANFVVAADMLGLEMKESVTKNTDDRYLYSIRREKMSKKTKKVLKENFTAAGGVVSGNAFSNLDMGFRTSKSTKLKSLVEDMYGEQKPKINVREFVQEIGQFSSFGNEIYREGNLRELASRLSKLAETAKQHTLQETEDWFDKITVNRNMKELTSLSGQFKKVATEAQSLQERMSTLYEDMGHILGRYYEVNGSVEQPEVSEEYNGIVREGEYEEFFQKAMKKFGISSPDELDDDEKKKFFNYVDKNYSAKNEKD